MKLNTPITLVTIAGIFAAATNAHAQAVGYVTLQMHYQPHAAPYAVKDYGTLDTCKTAAENLALADKATSGYALCLLPDATVVRGEINGQFVGKSSRSGADVFAPGGGITWPQP